MCCLLSYFICLGITCYTCIMYTDTPITYNSLLYEYDFNDNGQWNVKCIILYYTKNYYIYQIWIVNRRFWQNYNKIIIQFRGQFTDLNELQFTSQEDRWRGKKETDEIYRNPPLTPRPYFEIEGNNHLNVTISLKLV